MIVHHVKMDEIGSGVLYGANLFAKPGKVGRQDTGGNPERSSHDPGMIL
jgi:hypothetical protein